MFSTESEMTISSLPLVLSEFENENSLPQYIEEPKGLFGIPDLLLFNGRVIAIEYKLKNWKQAIKQAYRYKSFSEESYVLLDKEYIDRARDNLDLFTKFNIGLASVDNDKLEFHYKPISTKPFSEELSEKALSLF